MNLQRQFLQIIWNPGTGFKKVAASGIENGKPKFTQKLCVDSEAWFRLDRSKRKIKGFTLSRVKKFEKEAK